MAYLDLRPDPGHPSSFSFLHPFIQSGMDPAQQEKLRLLLSSAHAALAGGNPRESLAAVLEAVRLSGASSSAFPDLQRAVDICADGGGAAGANPPRASPTSPSAEAPQVYPSFHAWGCVPDPCMHTPETAAGWLAPPVFTRCTSCPHVVMHDPMRWVAAVTEGPPTSSPRGPPSTLRAVISSLGAVCHVHEEKLHAPHT